MIAAAETIVAEFDILSGGQNKTENRRVLAWDDEGRALVLPGDKGGTLVPAETLPHFVGLRDLKWKDVQPKAPGGAHGF